MYQQPLSSLIPQGKNMKTKYAISTVSYGNGHSTIYDNRKTWCDAIDSKSYNMSHTEMTAEIYTCEDDEDIVSISDRGWNGKEYRGHRTYVDTASVILVDAEGEVIDENPEPTESQKIDSWSVYQIEDEESENNKKWKDADNDEAYTTEDEAISAAYPSQYLII